MVGALLVLAVVALAIGGVTRACSFAPAGPVVDPSAVPTIDAAAALDRYARSVPFPVRVPSPPAGWRSTTAGLDPVGGTSTAKAVRVGYLTPENRFVRLMQSDVPEETMLTIVTGPRQVPARGPVDVAGHRWVGYGADDAEPIWITDTGAARLLVTGSGSAADLAALAAAAQSAPIARR